MNRNFKSAFYTFRFTAGQYTGKFFDPVLMDEDSDTWDYGADTPEDAAYHSSSYERAIEELASIDRGYGKHINFDENPLEIVKVEVSYHTRTAKPPL